MISPDGNWWWNGREWRPVSELGRRRGPGAWLVGCGLLAAVVVLGLGTCAVVGGLSSSSAARQAADDAACSPQPCANASGFVVYVDRIEWQYNPPGIFRPEAGNQFARVTIRFANHATSEKHADPFQFVLEDQQRVKHALVYAGDGWQAVNLAPGGTFGPRAIDFQVSSGTLAGALIWTPDLRDRRIPLAA